MSDLEILVFKGNGRILTRIDINSGNTLCTCTVCGERKTYSKKYQTEYISDKRLKNRYTTEHWFCSDECVNFFVLRYLM